MKKLFVLFTFLILGFNYCALGQINKDSTNKAVSKLTNFITQNSNEKVYLHFDHPYAYYVAGETVFFKAYLTTGPINLPSTISGILNVELFNKKDSLLQAVKLQLNNGTGWGDFLLPENLPKGTYRIRAYTNWMRNEKEPNYFEKYLSVSSASGLEYVSQIVDEKKPSLQFFPEGGNLVADVESKVGFKAIANNGLGINFKAVIVDNLNNEIANISSSHLGMGMFKFTPEVGRVYQAKVTFENGYKDIIELPKVEKEGITLSINTNDTNKIAIEIKANRTFYKQNLNKKFNLVIYSGGVIRTVDTKLDNSILGLDLPTNTFKTGVLQVTLFAESGEPLCERLLFIKNNKDLKLKLTTDKQIYKKREKVFVDLDVKNKEGNITKGSYSVSVIDESKVLVDENSETTIQSYLLLTSDLKGYIEKPNYYFANHDNNTRKDLDVLMLTQGYRRFVWKEILKEEPKQEILFNPERSVDITGFLKNKAGEPVAESKLVLIKKAGGMLPLVQTTDIKGQFSFKNANFYSGDRFILKADSITGKNQLMLSMDTNYYGPVKSPISNVGSIYDINADILSPTFVNKPLETYSVSNKNLSLTAEKNKVKTLPVNANNVRSTKIGGSGNADQVILASQILPGTTLSDGLNGIVRGVDFSQGQPYLRSNQKIGATGSEPMLVYVDGVDFGNMDDIAPGDVESIEILKGSNASIYGVRGANGVMIINTKKIGEQLKIVSINGKELSPGIFSIAPKGFYKAKEFYSPIYDQNTLPNTQPDLRTTIFWQPNLVTDDNGKASFNFFNSDGVGNYRVVIEGIDKNGNLGRTVYRYKVTE